MLFSLPDIDHPRLATQPFGLQRDVIDFEVAVQRLPRLMQDHRPALDVVDQHMR